MTEVTGVGLEIGAILRICRVGWYLEVLLCLPLAGPKDNGDAAPVMWYWPVFMCKKIEKAHDEEVVSLFLTDTPAKIAELRRDWEQNDFDAVRRVAHYLKGSAMYLGERGMSGFCEDIRVRAATGDAVGVGELLVSLEEEFAEIEERALWRKGANAWD